MNAGKPYKGVLAERMKPNPDNAAAGLLDYFDRIIALQEHYAVPDIFDGGLMQLVLKLAQDHVPGFQFEQQTGVKPKHPDRDFIIFAYICAAIEEGKNVSEASRDLEEKGWVGDLKWTAIRVRYYDLKKSGPELDRVTKRLIFLLKSGLDLECIGKYLRSQGEIQKN